MATKRKKEEQLLKSLRQLTALSHNKKCLECQQRGPTYADMTTRGFVCTSCGGYLRGLNPPHRVKSISMTTFSEDELTLLKDGGNELAHAVWMGRWNPRQDKEASKKDEVAFKEFLISKYERKMWYKAEVKRESEAKNESSTPTAEAKILPPPSTKRSAGTAATFAVQPPSSTPAAVPVTSATPQPTPPTATSTANAGSTGQQKPDLLGGVDDPFGEWKFLKQSA
jgi:Arf-GAP domain and FG repeat-containing protein 1